MGYFAGILLLRKHVIDGTRYIMQGLPGSNQDREYCAPTNRPDTLMKLMKLILPFDISACVIGADHAYLEIAGPVRKRVFSARSLISSC